jgi:copper ion binding protein
MAETITFDVTGMSCDHCVQSVTKAVKDVAGVANVTVSLDENSAIVVGDAIDTAKVIQAIEEEGYEAAVR